MTIFHKDIPETQIAVLLGPNERSLATIPVGKPGPNEVLIENVAVAANPKDWKAAEMMYAPGEKFVEGNDVAGTIVAVGEGVSEYKVGSRVAAFSKMGTKDNKGSQSRPETAKHLADPTYIVRRLPAIHGSAGEHYIPHP